MTASDGLEYDVVIVGGGPAGLSAAIRLAQLSRSHDRPVSICLLEKGSAIGAHIVSGAVFDPRALTELMPDWDERGAPIRTEAREDRLLWLTASKAWRLPVPPPMKNHGNYIISLGALCRWLGHQAEELGVELYPGFAAADILWDGNTISGVATGATGIDRDGNRTARFEPPMELRARQTIFAEGCRGSLTNELTARLGLRDGGRDQTYGLGIKELWEVDPARHESGLVIHTVGWPLDAGTYGGSFLYHFGDNLVSVGFVVGLDYRNPYLSPFEEFQRFKTHPAIRGIFENGRRIGYGARAISEGGFQSIPRLSFPGGLLVGDAAGFLNVPRIKGSHTAIKSGMIAADAVFDALDAEDAGPVDVSDYATRLSDTWVWPELHRVRNIRPSFHWGLYAGLAYSALDTYLLRGRAPWTFRHGKHDHEQLQPKNRSKPIRYPKPDGVVSFDRDSSVALSNVNHSADQPCHLRLFDKEVPISINLELYDAPEQRYCPAGVYEIAQDGNRGPKLHIHAQNCVHCKTCDIKDPTQNIRWVPPEGGGGPKYPDF